MGNRAYDLDNVLDIPKWEKLQDHLALTTKMAIITVDYKGIPVSKHSGRCPFCTSVRTDPQLEKYCQSCDSRAGLEAVRNNKPYIYLCHFNIVDIAIPITIDDRYVGAVMAGQVKVADSQNMESLEKLFPPHKNKKALQHLQEHQDEYNMIPTLSYSDIQQSAQTLYHLCNYIVELTLKKKLIIQTYESLYKEANQVLNQPDHKEIPYNNFYKAPSGTNSSTVLQPALEYIELNYKSPITQEQLSTLCHLSSAYFSRLFTKEIGESPSVYLFRKRIQHACTLLENTDLSINQISDELNFNSPGYFIKVFKKFEGITPLVYRKYYQDAKP